MNLVRSNRKERILELRLNRPEKKNAVNTAMLEELANLCERFRRDPEVRVVLLRGEGGSFCAGADLAEVSNSDAAALRQFHDTRERAFALIEDFACPTVAVIEGYALGTGLELALCADFRVASSEDLLGIPSSRLGVVESYLYITRLVRAVGLARANFMVFTGERLSAEEAQRIGLVERVIPRADIEDKIQALALALAGNAAGAISHSKRVLKECAEDPYLHSVSDPARPMIDSRAGEEMREGTQAFLEKREAKFDP